MNTRAALDQLNEAIEKSKNGLLQRGINSLEEYKYRVGFIDGLEAAVDLITYTIKRDDD